MLMIYRGVRYNVNSAAADDVKPQASPSVRPVSMFLGSAQSTMTTSFSQPEIRPALSPTANPLEEIATSQLYKTGIVLILALMAGIGALM